MLLKFLGKEYPLKIEDLEKKTIGGLKEQIRKTISPCAEVNNDNILLFHNKAKVSANDETALDDESVNFTDDSIVYIVSLLLNKPVTPKTQGNTSSVGGTSTNSHNINNHINTSNSMNESMGNLSNNMNYGNTSNMFNNSSVNMDDMFDKLLANPELMNNMYENMSNFLPAEQRQSFSYAMEMFKKNPEMMRRMIKAFGNQNGGLSMGNLMAGMQQNMNGMQQNMNGMSPNMNNMSPNMNNMSPNMNGMSSNMNNMSPNMNGMSSNMNGMSSNMNGMSPNMNGMASNMNNMSYNMNGMSPNMNGMPYNMNGMPYNMNGMLNNHSLNTRNMSQDMNGRRFGLGHTNLSYSDLFELVFNCPKDGPCCHNFYPLKESDGNKIHQNPEDVYSVHLASLSEMGFLDKQQNLQALIQSKGDLAEAIEILTKKNHK